MGRIRPILFLALALAAAPPARADCDRARFRVVLDVGHSPDSPGAISARGGAEYGFNLRLAEVIAARLRRRGFGRTVRLLSKGGRADLPARTARANALRPDLLLSIHHDSVQSGYLEPWTVDGRAQLYCDRFAGWSLFVSGANPRAQESVAFAQSLADRLLAAGLPFSGHHAEPIQGEGRPLLDPRRGLHRFDGLVVLKGATAPAVLLEAGLIVNRDEELHLADGARQQAIAQAVAEAVEDACTTATIR